MESECNLSNRSIDGYFWSVLQGSITLYITQCEIHSELNGNLKNLIRFHLTFTIIFFEICLNQKKKLLLKTCNLRTECMNLIFNLHASK